MTVKRINSIALGVLFLWVPFAFFARAADGFTLTKEFTAVLALLYLGGSLLGGGRQGLKSALPLTALLFLLWMVGDSLVVGLLKAEVLKGSIHLLLFGGTLGVVLLACQGDYSYKRLIHYALVAGAGMACYGLVQAVGLDRLSWNVRFENRAFSTLGNPNYLGGHLVGLLPLSFVMILQGESRAQKLWWRTVTLLLLAGFLATRVRGAELALAGTLLFLVFVFLSSWGKELFQRNFRFIWVALGLVAALGGVFIARHGGLASFGMSQVSVRQRFEIYGAAWEMVKDHPLAGIGLGQVGIQMPVYQAKAYPPSEYPLHPYSYTEHIHNEFLQFWVEGGLPGLLLFLGMLLAYGAALRRFLADPQSKREDRELLIGVTAGGVALLLQSLTNFPLQIAPTAILFGLFLAGPLAFPKTKAEDASPRFSPMAFLGLIPVLLAVAGLGLRAVASSIAYRDTVGETSLGHGYYAARYGERLTALSSVNPKAWSAAAKALELAVQPDQAANAYRKVLELNPNAVEDWEALGSLHLRGGQAGQALEEFGRAVAIAPNYSSALWGKALALYQLNRFAEAAAEFEKLSGYFPKSPQVYSNLGVCYIQLGRKEQAVEAWRRAYDLDPRDPKIGAYLKANGAALTGK